MFLRPCGVAGVRSSLCFSIGLQRLASQSFSCFQPFSKRFARYPTYAVENLGYQCLVFACRHMGPGLGR